MRDINSTYYLSLLLLSINYCYGVPRCGEPGSPWLTKYDVVNGTRNDNAIKSYNNGTIIEYKCKNAYDAIIDMDNRRRVCVNGKWIGKKPICGNI